ncbi:Branched-chain amino acid aminotransferase [Candidatus Nitrosotalea sp. TS]|nr:Branched-chain amino acid aminotransferase [Candidatus Nitrosotalea sp. TS]
MTGTAAEITPIVSVDGKSVGNGKAGKLTQKIQSTYSEIVMGRNKKHYSWITPVY